MTATGSSSTLRGRLVARRHTALLVAIITAFTVRPLIGDSAIAAAAFSIALLLVLLLALYTIQVDELVGEREALLIARRRRGLVAWGLAALAIVERVTLLVAPNHVLYVAGSVSWLAFFCFVTWHEWRSVLRQKEVTSETISMAISVYLLLGLSWGLLYALIFEYQPEAFSFGGSPLLTAPANDARHVFPVFVYFSLTTLSTVGYGDITPVTLQARYAAVAEGITGQLYLAILVARLVGINLSRQGTP